MRTFRRLNRILPPCLTFTSVIIWIFYLSTPYSKPGILETNSLLDSSYLLQTFVTSTQKIVTSTIQERNCKVMHIDDDRSFYERESNQKNLPSKIENPSIDYFRQLLRGFRLAVTVCAKNIGSNMKKFRNRTEEIIQLFHPESKIFVLDLNSTDKTFAELKEWKRAKVFNYKDVIDATNQDKEMIVCHNELLAKAHKMHADFMLVVDPKIFASSVPAFISNFEWNFKEWSVMTANLKRKSYDDIASLRTLSEAVINFDIWERFFSMVDSNNYCNDTVLKNLIDVHRKKIPPKHNLIEVRSAFGGAALYHMNATKNCKYSGQPHVSTHVEFHLCLKEKNSARIFINPKFTQ